MFVVALVMMMYINRAVGFARVPAFTVRRGALSVLRGAEEQEKETGHQTGAMGAMPELSDEVRSPMPPCVRDLCSETNS